MSESESANDEDRKDESNNDKNEGKNAKNKKTSKNKIIESDQDEGVGVESRNKNKRNTQKLQKNVENIENTSKKGKIPLLDQPVIIEGTRSRRTVVQFETKTSISKFSPVEIPNGKGTPLGQIPNINSRLKRLRQNVLKELHRTLFGKCGNPANFIVNLQKFNGFLFEKESEQYNRKILLFNKFPNIDIKELLYFLDLDTKIKRKEDSVKTIVDFLLSPDISATEQTSQPVAHPKRKATKRNYENGEIEETNVKTKKKSTGTSKSSSRKTESNDVTNNGKVESQEKTKRSIKNKTTEGEELETDNNSELKKPAKKRKRNQVIEESKEVTKESKSQKRKSNNTREKEQQVESSASESESVEETNKTELTDDELKSFLQKILADANLEKTTMKTVFNLISEHYPKYNFTKKKEFIKEVVKSLTQT